MPIGGALALFIVGATLRFALNEPVHGVDLHIAGVILMLAGLIAVVLSVLVRSGPSLPTLRRPVVRRTRPPAADSPRRNEPPGQG
jgi:hypothetical protein